MTLEVSTGLQLRSLIKSDGEWELSLVAAPTPTPADDEVIVRVEAAPINPTDIALMFGAADIATAVEAGSPGSPVVRGRVPEKAMKAMAGRVDQSLPVGSEGAGTVIAAGASPSAQRLLGKKVAMVGGAMYAQYRRMVATECLALPEGATAADGASALINPLTALGMVETMRDEGHKALVHTAAASNLGQMLNKICLKDDIGLVNIVRGEPQAEILRAIGASHACNSSAPSFLADLEAAVAATGATLAFDAIGGGELASQILTAMEAAAARSATTYNRYGTSVYKQVYVYGGLDPGPIVLRRSFGAAWGVGGWLVFPYMQKIGPHRAAKLRARIVAELGTTFASRYSRVISLQEALELPILQAYAKRATGEKFLIDPHKSS